ncbi:hypothetical protein [Methanoregula sp.]|uniref:tubulin/FtsZ family protein n=1 Tax=Methanoregula sp. TaxID=2052170 RepID=UPI00356A59FF
MRIVAIGLGGAGSRIVDRLYATDRKSSKVACVQGLAIDVDEDSLKKLENLPDSAKLYFPPLDQQLAVRNEPEGPTSTIDISEIIAKIQTFESGEIDAVFICSGLGGSLTDVAPHVIAGLRSAIVEPIFGLVTLPCLAEGEKRSAKAADNIDILSPILDGMILFDNETWYKKTAALKEKILHREKGFAERLGFGKQEPEMSPQMVTYRLLNDSIVRRISLILRAGEFRADGGIDLAEVVLDSGEVINTMKGMGFITIGYAVDHIPEKPLGFLSQWRPKGIFDDENKKKASRIVDLAKQAIYNEISTPCDMTSAHKALILVAGPTHELSMMGFMTVRKWIDRSIAGLETRSGDYPVVNTKNVAIIIMLTGLENIPRVGELRDIREHYRHPSIRRVSEETAESGSARQSSRHHRDISDEMIVLPPGMQRSKGEESPKPVTEAPRAGEREIPIQKKPQPSVQSPAVELPPTRPDVNTAIKPTLAGPAVPLRNITGENRTHDESIPPATHARPVITRQGQIPPQQRETAYPPLKRPELSPVERQETTTPFDAGRTIVRPPGRSPETTLQETARQRIERELERQRILSTPQRVIKSDNAPASRKEGAPTLIRPRIMSSHPQPGNTMAPHGEHGPSESGGKTSETRTVLISRKKVTSPPPPTPVPEPSPVPKQEKYIAADEADPKEIIPEEHRPESRSDEPAIDLKDPSFRAKDRVFEGKTVQKGFVPLPRDSTLLKGNLHMGKKPPRATNPESGSDPNLQMQDETEAKKKEKSIKKKDDISWI